MISRYVTYAIWLLIERESDIEFDKDGWRNDPDMDEIAKVHRDEELYLDMTGNIDASIW